MKIKLLVFILLFLLLGSVSLSQSNVVPYFSFNSGFGTFSQPNNEKIYSAIGQPLIGVSLGSSPKIINGFLPVYSGLVGLTGSDALPVEIASFTAVSDHLNAELTWTTVTEVNNYGFEVERAINANRQWTKVGFVAGNGTTNAPHNYSYSDNVGSAGTYSYRLKQIDRNGAFKYSQEVVAAVGAAPRVLALSQNYPNPFNPATSIQFTVPDDGRVMLKIFNTLGQEVAALYDGVASAGEYHQATFDASRLASGVYFSRLEFKGKQLMKKMLMLK